MKSSIFALVLILGMVQKTQAQHHPRTLKDLGAALGQLQKPYPGLTDNVSPVKKAPERGPASVSEPSEKGTVLRVRTQCSTPQGRILGEDRPEYGACANGDWRFGGDDRPTPRTVGPQLKLDL